MKLDRAFWKMFAFYLAEIILFVIAGEFLHAGAIYSGWGTFMIGVIVSIYVGKLIERRAINNYEKD